MSADHIPAGEEISLSYGPHLARMPYDQRRKELKNVYFFDLAESEQRESETNNLILESVSDGNASRLFLPDLRPLLDADLFPTTSEAENALLHGRHVEDPLIEKCITALRRFDTAMSLVDTVGEGPSEVVAYCIHDPPSASSSYLQLLSSTHVCIIDSSFVYIIYSVFLVMKSLSPLNFFFLTLLHRRKRAQAKKPWIHQGLNKQSVLRMSISWVQVRVRIQLIMM